MNRTVILYLLNGRHKQPLLKVMFGNLSLIQSIIYFNLCQESKEGRIESIGGQEVANKKSKTPFAGVFDFFGVSDTLAI